MESATKSGLDTARGEAFYAEIYQSLENRKRVCETQRFGTGAKTISDCAWCMERFHDRLFKILWRMKRTV
jgi:hypothetical protein